MSDSHIVLYSFEIPFPNKFEKDHVCQYFEEFETPVNFYNPICFKIDNSIQVFSGNPGNGDQDDAAEFVQLYLRHFDIDGGIYFSWSELNHETKHFGGGGFVITKKDIFVVTSSDVLSHTENVKILNF